MKSREQAKPPFTVGDKVTSEFYRDEADVVRTVTLVERDERYGSGWAVSADGGLPCPCCGRRMHDIPLVDSTWFKKAPQDSGGCHAVQE